MEWTNEKIIHFIKEIEMRPVIWDPHNEDYKNRNVKHDVNRELGDMFECDSTEVLRKWKVILAQHRREKQKIRTSFDSYKPKWFAFQYLHFLRELNDINEQIYEPEMQLEQEQKPTSQELQDDMSRSRNRYIPKRQRHESISDIRVSEAFTLAQNKRQKTEERNEDDLDIFSSGVAAKLRQIKNEHLKLLVQRDIDNLLYDALLGTGKYTTI